MVAITLSTKISTCSVDVAVCWGRRMLEEAQGFEQKLQANYTNLHSGSCYMQRPAACIEDTRKYLNRSTIKLKHRKPLTAEPEPSSLNRKVMAMVRISSPFRTECVISRGRLRSRFQLASNGLGFKVWGTGSISWTGMPPVPPFRLYGGSNVPVHEPPCTSGGTN